MAAYNVPILTYSFLRIGDVLDSLDLNPVIATLGEDVGQIVNTTVGDLTGSSSSSSSSSTSTSATKKKRSSSTFDPQNVLYSVNDYSGNTHTNRVLGQDGNLYDVKLDNDGDETGRTEVGSYLQLMTFGGHNHTVAVNGQVREYELQYVYGPFPGVESYCWIYVTPAGRVTRTQVIAEAFGGGSSTISDDDGEDL